MDLAGFWPGKEGVYHPSFLHHVRNFVAAVKKYHVSLGWECTICLCNSCKNKLLQKDNVVQSHLICHGFVENFIVWKFHSETDPSVTGASERNSLTTSSVNERGQQRSSSTATAGGNDRANRDYYINIDDLIQYMGGNGGGGNGEQGEILGPEGAEIFENLANRMNQDDILFGNPR